MTHHTSNQQKDLARQQKELLNDEARFAEIDIVVQNLYEDKIKGKLDECRFMVMMKSYEKQKHQLQVRIKELKSEINKFNDKREDVSRFIDTIKKYANIKTLNLPQFLGQSFCLIYEDVVFYQEIISNHCRSRRNQYADI